jgi:CubicO group peptidase (beta-lactamase class C family)
LSLDDGIATASADSRTLPPATAEALVQGVLDGRYADVHSILIHRGDHLLLEEYFYGYDRERMHQMRSFTKSVIALLAGAAIDRGSLQANAPMLVGLGDEAAAGSDPRKSRITLTHLLSHSSGLACNDHDGNSPGNEAKLYEQPDWIRAFVQLPMLDEPGHVAHYCSGGILAAGRMVERATQTSLPDFAQAHLFGELGVGRDAWQWPFELDNRHRNEFGQVYLRSRDMLKLGLLIKGHGQWNGHRVVSAAWIDAMTASQSHVDDSDYGLGLWHRWYRVMTPSGPQRVDTLMLSGNGGQKVYIVPALDLIAVFTGGAFNQDSPVNTMMADVLLPALLEVPLKPEP